MNFKDFNDSSKKVINKKSLRISDFNLLHFRYKFNDGADSIDIVHPGAEGSKGVNNTKDSEHFKVDKLLQNATQDQVFHTCTDELLTSLMEGYNGTLSFKN